MGCSRNWHAVTSRVACHESDSRYNTLTQRSGVWLAALQQRPKGNHTPAGHCGVTANGGACDSPFTASLVESPVQGVRRDPWAHVSLASSESFTSHAGCLGAMSIATRVRLLPSFLRV